MLNDDANAGATLTTPDVSDVFASAATYQTASAEITKQAGSGDSVRNQKSSKKAPGGNDAAHQKDGG
jgi:hypothetical protein